MAASFPHWLLEQEGRALLTRLARIKPFALHEPMVAAAAASTAAQSAIERSLAEGRRELRGRVTRFLEWIRGPGASSTPEDAQRRFTFLRLRFNVVLSHFDIFADVLTQRSEHETGVWLSGLDVVAEDALALPGVYEHPPVVCYLDRGHGAAIRRARTRLPGGGESPVAIIRVPRERMVGSGIASSLVHEVGHQAAALLDLVNELRPALGRARAAAGPLAPAWVLYERWISEIVADFWSVARVGVGSTTGLMGVVSLPRAFVFRGSVDDPHPIPWVRVRLSCAMGAQLHPDPQWGELSRAWEQFYPLGDDVPDEQRRQIEMCERAMPAFVRMLAGFRPSLLRGRTLAQAMEPAARSPARLRALYRGAGGNFQRLRGGAPSLVFAILGQARADGAITPEQESRLLADLLTFWALRSTLETTDFAAARPRAVAALSITG
ncbi:hypothetical protein [Longimicrobium sp.]|jgi:hypothetical protein|uniref:hypothetical protein n=1 Tax=Longimicrobium sp. TaxID=2029185 RepID=UPI002ED8578A